MYWVELTSLETSQVGSTRYVTHVINFTRLPRFSCAAGWEEPVYIQGYMNIITCAYEVSMTFRGQKHSMRSMRPSKPHGNRLNN